MLISGLHDESRRYNSDVVPHGDPQQKMRLYEEIRR